MVLYRAELFRGMKDEAELFRTVCDLVYCFAFQALQQRNYVEVTNYFFMMDQVRDGYYGDRNPALQSREEE